MEKKKRLEEDYYAAALRECGKGFWFPLVRTEMEKIAKSEQEKNGAQFDADNVNVQPLFSELALTAAVLEAEPRLASLRNEMMKLPEKERKEAMALMEQAVLRGWYKDDALIGTQPLREALDDAREKMLHDLARTFGMPEIAEMKEADLDLRLLTAMREYMSGRNEERKKILEPLRDILTHVLKGDYAEWKMAGKEWMPKMMTPEAYAAWAKDDRMEMEEVLSFDVRDIARGLQSVLNQAVADQHITREALLASEDRVRQEERRLNQPLMEKQERLGMLREKMAAAKKEKKPFAQAEEYRALQEEIAMYREEHAAALQRLRALRFFHRLPRLTTEELEKKSFALEKKMIPWTQAFKAMEEGFRHEFPEFLQDVARIKAHLFDGFERVFSGARLSRSSLEITDRTDAATAFFIGEKPVPSCQSYKSSGGFNLGLLSYVMDPNVKLIQARGEDGELVARAALRLLEDEQGNPQLFLERVYSTNPHPKIQEAFVAFAKRKAASMRAGLFTHVAEGVEEDGEVRAAEKQEARLISRGSRAPYVYTDAGEGLKRGGEFEIIGARRM